MVASLRTRILTIIALSGALSPLLCGAENVITLTSNTFEHETQASTGSTTGDWLIKVQYSGQMLLYLVFFFLILHI